MAAVERLVEPLGRDRQRPVGLRRLGRLPVKGAAQQHQHPERHHEQRHDLRHIGAPGGQHRIAGMDHQQAAGVGGKRLHLHEGAFAVIERRLGHLLRAVPPGRQEVRREDLGQPHAPETALGRRRRPDPAGPVHDGEDASRLDRMRQEHGCEVLRNRAPGGWCRRQARLRGLPTIRSPRSSDASPIAGYGH